jgi:signal transduction histidine kinase/ligand-binding sensor domain-containing protein
MPPLRVLSAFLLACAGAAPATAAANSTVAAPPAGFTTRLWQTEDGLPQNSVTSIAQTRDGYLWIGTYGGLARFDGVRFRNFDAINTPALTDARIISLHEDRDGGLWIGHDSGHVTRYHDGQFVPVKTDPDLSSQRVVAINEDAAGVLWILRDTGVLEPVAAAGRRPLLPERAHKPQLLSLIRSGNGELYVDEDGGVASFGQALQPIDFGPAQHTGFVMAVGPAQHGGIWIVRDWLVQRWEGGRLVENRGPSPWGADVSVGTLLEMRSGWIAVGTMDRGLFLVSPDRRVAHFDHTNGLPQDWVRALAEDREGNLWVGAGSAGLVEVVPTPVSVISPPDQWQGRTELAVAAARDGSLWVGTEGAGLYRYEAGRWSHFGQELGLEHPFVWSVAAAVDGQIWAGTWGGGLFRHVGDHFERVPHFDPGAGPVLALEYIRDRQELWVGGAAGLQRWPDGQPPEPVGDLGGPERNVGTVVRDEAGVVWFGVTDAGLGCLDHGRVRRLHKRDGLSSDAVQCLLADADGALWIGTADAGLNRLKGGRFSVIGPAQGLVSNTICAIQDDGRGYLWLSTHHGLVRVAKAELNRCADGRSAGVEPLVFDRNDGLPTIEFSGGSHNAACKSPDGRLWFATGKGVVVVDPANIRLNPVPPPVVLEAVRVDGELVERGSGLATELRLRPEHQRLEFQFTALSFTAPAKVQFKYRLEGIDNTWVDAGTKRTASYSRLPAGRYAFHVIACNNDGLWNEKGASMVCTVLPFFWQTWWFVGLSTVLVLGGVIWTVRYLTHRRMERRLEALERRHALERERARIAQDIHDDIGATLTRITMLSQCLPRGAAQPSGVVEQIYDTAREATRALDEIVWAVNPRHDSLESLVSYMGKYAQDFLGAAGIRCRLYMPVKLPEWPLTAEVRHNLFLAFKEALNNVVKHAGAPEVHVALELRPDAFVLMVSDDGRGFDRAAGAAAGVDRIVAGSGLRNMQRRLEAIGGRCDIVSRPGRGAAVAFHVGMYRSKATRRETKPHIGEGAPARPA